MSDKQQQTRAEKLQAFQDKLDSMQQQFRESLPARLNEINSTWQQLQQSQEQLEHLSVLHRQVHTLTGTAGTFACQKLSQASRALEIMLKSLLNNSSELDRENIKQISSMIKSLETISENASSSSLIQITVNTNDIDEDRNRILILDDDQNLNRYLSLQFEHFGYQVCSVTNLSELEERVAEFQPCLIIADVMFPEGQLAGIEALYQMQFTRVSGQPVQVVFTSSRQDIEARLQAVRANGQAYFSKPVNISAMLDKVHELTDSHKVDPYQIMVIDDDVALVELLTYVLEQSGMEVCGVTDPQNTLEAIQRHKPDLILMDVHMPWCSGIELAQVIRQHANLAVIPIIFLSSDTDEDIQHQAVLKGGDDFLNKPIDVNKLPDFIRSRSQRARAMNAMMIRDGLTGLYNHTYIKENVESEMNRAERKGGEFSVVMLDVDLFKQVNDTYGHSVGDQVLRSLSHFLLQRLRKIDKIGRYGGEEFMLVLSDTPLAEAQTLMNKMLQSFIEVVHSSSKGVFNVSFSAGVSSNALASDTQELIEQADQALYRAKKAGRSQVILAGC